MSSWAPTAFRAALCGGGAPQPDTVLGQAWASGAAERFAAVPQVGQLRREAILLGQDARFYGEGRMLEDSVNFQSSRPREHGPWQLVIYPSPKVASPHHPCIPRHPDGDASLVTTPFPSAVHGAGAGGPGVRRA